MVNNEFVPVGLGKRRKGKGIISNIKKGI